MKKLLMVTFFVTLSFSTLALAKTTHFMCANSTSKFDLSWKSPYDPTGISLKEVGENRLYSTSLKCSAQGNPLSGGNFMIHSLNCTGRMPGDRQGTTTAFLFRNTESKTAKLVYVTSMIVNNQRAYLDRGTADCTEKESTFPW